MFKYKKCKLEFEKTSWWDYRLCTNKVIPDSDILAVLCSLQNTYKFKILSIRLKSYERKSRILLKCKKKDKFNILRDFCKELDDYIEAVSWS